jgi:hypothetical protein
LWKLGAAMGGLLAVALLLRISAQGSRETRALVPNAEARLPTSTDVARRVDVSSDEFKRLRREVSNLRQRLIDAETARATGESSDAVSDSESSPNVEPPPAPLDGASMHQGYDTVFEGELTDVAWARNEERAITTFVSSNGASKLESVECRTHMCRIVVSFSDARSREMFRARIGEPPLDHGGFYHIDSDGNRLTYFEARAGEVLPPL